MTIGKLQAFGPIEVKKCPLRSIASEPSLAQGIAVPRMARHFPSIRRSTSLFNLASIDHLAAKKSRELAAVIPALNLKSRLRLITKGGQGYASDLDDL